MNNTDISNNITTEIKSEIESKRESLTLIYEKFTNLIKSGNVVKVQEELQKIKSNKLLYWFIYCKMHCYYYGKITHLEQEELYRDLDDVKYNYQDNDIKKEIDYILKVANVLPNKRLLTFSSDENQFKCIKIAPNFTWIDSRVCGSGIITLSNCEMLQQFKITQVITLTENPLDKAIIKQYPHINFLHFPIPDRNWTNLETLKTIISYLKLDKITLVHCMGGVGRTNTVLAAYLLTIRSPLNSSEAIALLKVDRKCILTGEQVQVVKAFEINKLNVKKLKGIKSLPKVIMMIGPPAVGKSTLSQELLYTYGTNNIVHLTQDDLGRKECQAQFTKYLKSKSTCIILDRCNLTKQERKEWLSQLLNEKQQVLAIYFNVPLELCMNHLQKRTIHATLSSNGGEIDNNQGNVKILQQEFKKMEEPTLSEGFYQILSIVDYDTDLLKVKQYFGINMDNDNKETDNKNEDNNDEKKCPTKYLIKFPRTRHLFNLGSASRDDLVMTDSEAKDFLNVNLQINKNQENEENEEDEYIIIDEKIDGCSIGISINENNEFIVQNRSNFINSGYHPQFGLLDNWLYEHEDELKNIIRPNQDILFGEWVYAKHSISYNKLPDYFIAYDLYDAKNEEFIDRKLLIEKLSNIYLIRIIASIPRLSNYLISSLTNSSSNSNASFSSNSNFNDNFILDKRNLLTLINNEQSIYYNGPIEGLYLRKCKNGKTIARCKLVRKDFKCGNENWNKTIIIKNQLVSQK